MERMDEFACDNVIHVAHLESGYPQARLLIKDLIQFS